MKHKLKVFSLLFSIGLLFISIFPAPATAAIASPTTFSIYSVEAYRHYEELNDILIVAHFICDYAVNPTEGNLSDLFIARFMDGGTEFSAVSPYSYYDSGYSVGVVAIYYTAAEVTALGITWGDATYTFEMIGNPTLVWTAGAPPSAPYTGITWLDYSTVAASGVALTSRVRYLAQQIEVIWSVDLIELIGGVNKFTDYGDTYFTAVIPNLRTQCPSLYEAVMYAPSLPERPDTMTAANTRESALDGTRFDMGSMAVALGVPKIVARSIVWIILSAVAIIVVCMRLNAQKYAMLFLAMATVPGWQLGFMSIPVFFVTVLSIGGFGLFVVFHQRG